MKKRKFYSKVLLFGEYSVIKDSMALSIPYDLFEGQFAFPSSQNFRIDSELKALGLYLKKIDSEGAFDFDFDLANFEFDISQGLKFSSTIPQGYGVGSSGALCAAVLDRYSQLDNDMKINIPKLKSIFSLIESHFHGSSSGMDPLISYLNKPILKNEDGDYQIVDIKQEKGNGGIFLLNTGRVRRTEPLVNLFLEKCERPEFNALCEDVLIPTTNSCIKAFLRKDFKQVRENFDRISLFQFENFKPMIPKLYQDIWDHGLSSSEFSLKLCGAGGGGYLLGLTENFSNLNEELKNHEIRRIIKF